MFAGRSNFFNPPSSILAPQSPTGTLNILIASYDVAGWVQDVATNLTTASAKYPGLTLNITQMSGLRTLPTVSPTDYDVIFFWSDGSLAWNSSFDAHAANGRGLVTAQFYASTGISGITSGLMPIVSGSGGQSGGAITWPSNPGNHPIVTGQNGTTQKVTSFVTGGAGFAAMNPTLYVGSSTIAYAVEGAPYHFAIVKDGTARTVFLNMFPPSSAAGSYSSGWSMTTYPDGALLMLNALLWAAKRL